MEVLSSGIVCFDGERTWATHQTRVAIVVGILSPVGGFDARDGIFKTGYISGKRAIVREWNMIEHFLS